MPRKQVRTHVPSIVGMGLVALDVVISDKKADSQFTYAGGTCGNVLMALTYLGWKAYPISRLGQDKAAERVISDLHQWKISTEFISKRVDGSTPVIIQRIRHLANGIPHHSFSWRCPSCGAHLPSYKPILASMVEGIALRLSPSKVFFFDRVSRGTLLMAHLSRKRGAVVMFEPASIGDPGLFREAWSVAHIVKYAHERLSALSEMEIPDSIRDSVLLEIETCGSEGLRFRSTLPHAKSDGWVSASAFRAPYLKDAAGAGDWCTAGILDVLARNGIVGFKQASLIKVWDAIKCGQALAAWNCGFEGARGGMYQQDRNQLATALDRILKGRDRPARKELNQTHLSHRFMPQLCRACNASDTRPIHTDKRPSHQAVR